MKVESIKFSRQHKDCESANWARERPDEDIQSTLVQALQSEDFFSVRTE